MDEKPCRFSQTTRELHRWLMDAPAAKGQKSVGKAVVGVTTLLLVVILVSGLVIWIPRTRKALKHRLKVSCNKGWRRFWYDSHVALGFYAALFLLVMALTGLTWSFGWYRKAAYSLFGGGTQQTAAAHAPAKGNPGQDVRGGHGGRGAETERQSDYAVWDNVLDGLKAQYPVYKTITLNERSAQIAPRSAYVDAPHRYGAVRSARRTYRGDRPLSGHTPFTNPARVVLRFPHRVMGWNR